MDATFLRSYTQVSSCTMRTVKPFRFIIRTTCKKITQEASWFMNEIFSHTICSFFVQLIPPPCFSLPFPSAGCPRFLQGETCGGGWGSSLPPSPPSFLSSLFLLACVRCGRELSVASRLWNK